MIDRDEQVQKCTWYFESTLVSPIGPKAIFDSRYAIYHRVPLVPLEFGALWCGGVAVIVTCIQLG